MLAIHAAWVLGAAFVLSIAYETYRTTFKSHVSAHDSRAAFAKGLAVYVIAALMVAALATGFPGAAWIGLLISLVGIGVSTFYYNPVIMRDRQPGVIDWIEDILFTGLLFVAATLLIYDLAGFTLQSAR
jgi:hypothetical protein